MCARRLPRLAAPSVPAVSLRFISLSCAPFSHPDSHVDLSLHTCRAKAERSIKEAQEKLEVARRKVGEIQQKAQAVAQAAQGGPTAEA